MCGPRYGLGFLAESGLPESLGKFFQKAVAVFDSGGGGLGQPREPMPGCQVQLCRCKGVGAAPVQSQPVPEPPEPEFLVVSDAPVRCGVSERPSLAFFQRPCDCTGVSVRAPGYLCQGDPEGIRVELVRLGGVRNKFDHLVPAGLEGPAASGMFAGQDAPLLVTEGAGAGG